LARGTRDATAPSMMTHNQHASLLRTVILTVAVAGAFAFASFGGERTASAQSVEVEVVPPIPAVTYGWAPGYWGYAPAYGYYGYGGYPYWRSHAYWRGYGYPVNRGWHHGWGGHHGWSHGHHR
jgi:hypothetical protein